MIRQQRESDLSGGGSSPQVRELQERIQKAAACTCLLPLGRDRFYRRYWLLPSASTLFVEDDCFGLTEDMLHPCPKPAADTAPNMEHDEVVVQAAAEGRSVTSRPRSACSMRGTAAFRPF